MKTTITSADLASMAARVPDVAASRKLSLFDAIYLNVPEVIIDGESVCIDEAIEVAGLTRAPFVSLDIWTYLIRRSCSDKFGRNIPEDSPSADNLIRLVKSAAKHNGENERLGLRWAAHGLNYEWSATADWRRKLAFNLARADFEDQQESSHRENARKSDIDVLVTLLTGSPEFRAAQPTKRHSVGFAVVSISMYEAEEDVIRQALSKANTLVGRRAQELELSLKRQLDALTEEFRQTREWKAATSIPKRLAAADVFLIG